MLVPDCLTLFNGEAVLLELNHLYFIEGQQATNIIGLDFFLWPNVPDQFNGLVSLPTLRATVRSFGRQISKDCGNPFSVVPIFQYFHASTDFYYNPWLWDGYPGSGYSPQGALFGLLTPGTPSTQPLYECLIQQKTAWNHWLTFSPTCDNLPHQTPVVIGNAAVSGVNGTVALWRYCAIDYPWYHQYTTFSGNIPGMIKETITAYVLPQSVL